MVEIALPTNSRVKKGVTHTAEGTLKSPRTVVELLLTAAQAHQLVTAQRSAKRARATFFVDRTGFAKSHHLRRWASVYAAIDTGIRQSCIRNPSIHNPGIRRS